MSQPTVPAPSLDPADVDRVIQAVRFELYRENIYGALEIVEAAHAARPDPRYAEQAARIRSWLGHLQSREAYVAAQEQQYKGLRWRMGLKLLEKRIRMLSGRKTRKMTERRGRDPEFQQLEREVDAVKPARVLDAGSGEGGVAMALCARHPELTTVRGIIRLRPQDASGIPDDELRDLVRVALGGWLGDEWSSPPSPPPTQLSTCRYSPEAGGASRHRLWHGKSGRR